MTTIDDNTLMRVVAYTAIPEFVDYYGSITGTIGDTYNPTFVGERGFMLNVDAAPLDIGVEITGDQLAICFNHTPREIEEGILSATPIAASAEAVQARMEAIASAPPPGEDVLTDPIFED